MTIEIVEYRKSTFSGAGNDCVEVARPRAGGALVRDTKRRAGGALRVPEASWRALRAHVTRELD